MPTGKFFPFNVPSQGISYPLELNTGSPHLLKIFTSEFGYSLDINSSCQVSFLPSPLGEIALGINLEIS